jgi:hypothetical protein
VSVNGQGLARMALGGAGVLGLLAMGRLMACGQPGTSVSPQPQDAGWSDTDSGFAYADADAQADGTQGDASPDRYSDPNLPEAVVDAPPGWHEWPYPPKDCALFVPDDIKNVEPLIWEPCPFQPEGCTRAISPWGDDNGGWGFGASISLAIHDGATYLRVMRALQDYWVEVLLLRDNVPIAAWRYLMPDSHCFPIVVVEGDGRAGVAVRRTLNNGAAWVFLGPAETIMTAPERTLRYGDPGFEDAPVGHLLWSDDLLVLDSEGRFSIRDLTTNAFERPWPPGIAEGFGDLQNPIPLGRTVYYYLWTFELSSVWVRVPGGIHAALLKDDEHSYGKFVTDGRDAAWVRSSGKIASSHWETSELWTSPLDPADPAKLQSQMLAGDVGPGRPYLSVGEGWVAAHLDVKDVRLYRISDGLEKRLPVVPAYGWSEGMFDGLMIAGGAAWVVTHNWPGSNQVRYITRFEIDSLPSP